MNPIFTSTRFELTLESGDPPLWVGSAIRSFCLDQMRPTAERLGLQLKQQNGVQIYRCSHLLPDEHQQLGFDLVIFADHGATLALTDSVKSKVLEIQRSEGANARARFSVERHASDSISLAELSDPKDGSVEAWTIAFRSPTCFKDWPTSPADTTPPPINLLLRSIAHRVHQLGFADKRDAVAHLNYSAIHTLEEDLTVLKIPKPSMLRFGAVGSITFTATKMSHQDRMLITQLLRAACMAGVGKKTTFGFGDIAVGVSL